MAQDDNPPDDEWQADYYILNTIFTSGQLWALAKMFRKISNHKEGNPENISDYKALYMHLKECGGYLADMMDGKPNATGLIIEVKPDKKGKKLKGTVLGDAKKNLDALATARKLYDLGITEKGQYLSVLSGAQKHLNISTGTAEKRWLRAKMIIERDARMMIDHFMRHKLSRSGGTIFKAGSPIIARRVLAKPEKRVLAHAHGPQWAINRRALSDLRHIPAAAINTFGAYGFNRTCRVS